MSFFKPQKIQTKFLMGLIAIMLALGTFFTAGLYFHLRSLLLTQTKEKAEMILDQVGSIQGYIRQTLRPKMFSLLQPDEFMLEAMSTSYVTRQIMGNANLAGGRFVYRRTAVNARNPDYESNRFERELIDHFRRNQYESEWEGMHEVDGLQYFFAARPVRFTKGCLHCHGDPADAPKEMLERYGDARGFHRPVGKIGGLQSVALPVGDAVEYIRSTTVGYLMLYGAGTLFFFALIQIFFNRLVVMNLRRVTSVFRRQEQEPADTKLINRLEQGDEIEEAVRGVEELITHLHDARQQLRDHAANLEKRVAERTEDLAREVVDRQSDVRLFVQMLDGLTRSQTRMELILSVLELIGRRFGASNTAFICTVASERHFSWPDPGRRPALPSTWRSLVAENRLLVEPGQAFIPVESSEHLVEGLLCLEWDQGDAREEHDQEVLRAIGQQMGIAMAHLSALDDLLSHKDMLQSVFDGIADPLILLDGSCNVILANAAAHTLARADAPGQAPVDDPAETTRNFLAGLLDYDPRHKEDCPLGRVVTSGQPDVREVTVPGNRSFWMSLYPVQGLDGQDHRIIIYARENTSEKRMLARMQQHEKLVSVGKMAAGLAHELNNPLGVILCYTELLKSAFGEGQSQSDVEVIERHAKQAQKVLQDLLGFARTKKPATGPCHVPEVLASMVGIFNIQAERKNVRIEIQADPDLPPVMADSHALEQIVSNLLLNGLDAAPADEGVIRVGAAAAKGNGEVLLTVSDNGPGIPEDHMSQIFDPFFTTKDVGKGTGLGLAVVYGLVQEMGGRIEVENAGGAVFTIHLPTG